jgi:Zn-dependent protease
MDAMIVKIFIIAFLVESIVLHEIAHGHVALLFGDHTAQRQGRITFNPIPHIDPLWTIVIPVVAYFLSNGTFIIGGAKPVPVNPSNYRRPVLGDICVSVAGVAVNFLIAVTMILLLNMVHMVFSDLTGSMISVDDTPLMIATKIKEGNKEMQVRDNEGYPIWMGWKEVK